MKKSGLIFGILGAIVAIGLIIAFQFNGLVNLQSDVEAAQADIEVQLQRRYDLIPNVVSSVKGYMTHEKEIFTEIADARSKIGSNNFDSKEYKDGQSELSSAISRLLVLTESYPQLQANTQVTTLIAELEGTENRILVARKDYNSIASRYNKSIRRFPKNIFANMLGFEKVDLFNASDQARTTVPSVNLDNN